MASEIRRQIAQLPTLSRQQLLDLWRKAYKKPPPPRIRREILVPLLAYKLQENAYGGLKPAVRSELGRIARGLAENKCSFVRSRVKPGTRLLRQWRGETHEVLATNSGYTYRGKDYRSLSQIARVITGTQWSGPAFFGLRKNASAIDEHHE